MSEKKVKISVRVPKDVETFIAKLIAEGYFRDKSEFFNRASEYLRMHMEAVRTFTREKMFWYKGESYKVWEGTLHKKLKDLAVAALHGMGCAKIVREGGVLIAGKRYQIDVSGVTKKGKKIAVECYVGAEDTEKLNMLSGFFDEVFVLTPFDLIEWYESIIVSYKQTLNNISAKRDLPITGIFLTEPKVAFIEASDKVGKQDIPYKQIKGALLKGDEVVLKDITVNTLEALHRRLREDLKIPKGERRIFSSMHVDDKGKDYWILSLKYEKKK